MKITREYQIIWAILAIVVIAMIVLIASQPPRETAPELTNQFESNAFTVRYPADWEYEIPQPNIMFLASQDVLHQNAGASATIQRTIALAREGDTLEAKLTEVLTRGPLRTDRFWEQVGEISTLQVDTYDAVQARVVGSEQADTLQLQSDVVLLQAESGFVYIVTFTAPQADWSMNEPMFTALLASIDILE